VQGVVRNLEKQFDDRAKSTPLRSLLADENDELPDADALGAAV
jgi:hypothetical protein